MTESTTPTKKAATKKAANPPVDRAKVEKAAGEVGDRLEAERLARIAAHAPDPDNPEFWKWLARPFAPEDQEKLPKQLRRGDDDKGPCEDTPRGRKYSGDGHYCGGWHAKSIHLDYIGHAGITMRLNEDVGAANWSWRPMALTPEGLPLLGREFWIVLEILGVEKYGVGDDFNGSAKQAIGDALRNAAMRFGLGTYLWAKSEKAFNLRSNTETAQVTPPEVEKEAQAAGPLPHIVALTERVGALEATAKEAIQGKWKAAGFPKLTSVSPEQAAVINGWLDEIDTDAAKNTLGERLGAQEVGTEGQAAPDAAGDAGAQA